MKTYSLTEIIATARTHSSFYRELYKDVSPSAGLAELPVLKSEDFWKANTLEHNKVLTGPHVDGIVFKSGGTTGNPKFSFFTCDEWETFTEAFGWGMKQGGLKTGETISNMFYAGDLYASFLFITNSIEKCGAQVVQYPLSGGADFNHIVDTMNTFKITTWAGVPTSIMKLADYAQKNKLHPPNKILFGGESLYDDQLDFIKKVFPDTTVQSIGYASVDGGLLGFVDKTCEIQEHRVFSDHTIMEILDEDTLEAITETHRSGKLYLTNLTRKLMPLIRYPVGDKAMWLEEGGKEKYRKFKILGRSEEGARVGPATVYYDDISQLLHVFHHELELKGFQLHLSHFDSHDQLVIKIATHSNDELLKQKVQSYIYQERDLLKDLVRKKLIHPLLIEFTEMSSLETNSRTGKLKRIIDSRQ